MCAYENLSIEGCLEEKFDFASFELISLGFLLGFTDMIKILSNQPNGWTNENLGCARKFIPTNQIG